MRVTATGTSEKPVFIGITRSSQAGAYLRGVERDDITDFEVEPFSVTTARRSGSAIPTPPADQRIWAKSSTGAGRQTLTWPVRQGSWDVVVMNADGTSGVRTDVSVGAKVPALRWIGIRLLALGALLAVAAAASIYFGTRGPRSRPMVTRAAAPSGAGAAGA